MNGIEAAAAALGIPPASESVAVEPNSGGFGAIEFRSDHAPFIDPEPNMTTDEIADRIQRMQRKRDLRFLIAQARVEKLAIERQIVEFRRELASLKGKR